MITIIREDGMELENAKASLLYTSSHYYKRISKIRI